MVDEVNDEMKFLQPMFLWVSLGLSLLSVLFVLYYSSGVVSEKKREIGILRALGASRADVIKIFTAENGVFTGVIILLSAILAFVGVIVANSMLTANFGVSAVIIAFSIRQFAILSAISVGAIALGIAIPMINVLRAKPVDLIAGRK